MRACVVFDNMNGTLMYLRGYNLFKAKKAGNTNILNSSCIYIRFCKLKFKFNMSISSAFKTLFVASCELIKPEICVTCI